MPLQITKGLKQALSYSANDASEDVAGMLVTDYTATPIGIALGSASSGGGLAAGDPVPSGGFFGGQPIPPNPQNDPYEHTVPVFPHGGGLSKLGPVYQMAEPEHNLDFDEIIQKISIALEHLAEEELAEQLKAAKQINVLANQILAITFQSGLGDVDVSQALVSEAQALKARALAILRGILDFIEENGEECEDEEDEEDEDWEEEDEEAEEWEEELEDA